MHAVRALLVATALSSLALPSLAQTDPVAECDRLAASPYDANRVGPGVQYTQIDAPAALAACQAAVAQQPDEPRLRYQLGRALDAGQDYAAARQAYEAAAAQGYAMALDELGQVYEFGAGVEQDYARAADYYRRAAEAGVITANADLGHLYEEGLGVAQDPAEAVRLYRLAAEQGDAFAQNKLGYAYEHGIGVAPDDAQAVEWYRRSAEGGEPWGQHNLGVAYDQGLGVAEDDEEAARWYRLAADQANSWAMYNLAELYERGSGVPRDLAEAERLLRSSIEVANENDVAHKAHAMNVLAYLLAQQNQNLNEAQSLAEEAVATLPEDDPERANVIDTLGWVYHAQGKDAEAAEQLERAIALKPEDPVLHDHLGDVYAALGRTEEARTEWQKALDLPEPEQVDPFWNRAAIERKLQQGT